jgi:hypothetical protein
MYGRRAGPSKAAAFAFANGGFGSVVIHVKADRPLQKGPFVMSHFPAERSSTAPVAINAINTGTVKVRPTNPFASSWASMSGYLVAGVALGLLLIVALTVTRGEKQDAVAAGVVTDNVVHLHSREIGNSCWSGAAANGPARVTVALEVGLDGKVRYAAASGESPAMRGCVESHVKGWEFLPQAQAQAMVLPFEIDRR